MKTEIMVSVLVVAYNHEKTIARALNSILSQKTQYKYEIVIGEDASTDRTADIVREFANKYPDIIVPLIREKNLGAQKNGIDTLRHCQGNYIAFCEGDDYWLVDDKLEKQVSFLETHEEYSSCTTKCLYYHNGIEEAYPFSTEDCESLSDMLNRGNVKRYATCTNVVRNIYRYKPELLKYFSSSIVGDIIFETISIMNGKIHYIDYVTAVYDRVSKREGEKTSFSSFSLERQITEIRKAIETCKIISGKKYYSDWEKYEASFNRGLFFELCKIQGKRAAWIQVRKQINVKKEFYLLRLLLHDYLNYKGF